jgi:hypothetical protein
VTTRPAVRANPGAPVSTDRQASYVRSRSLEFPAAEQPLGVGRCRARHRSDRASGFIRSSPATARWRKLNDPFTAKEIADRVIENLTVDDAFSSDEMKSLIDAFRTINPEDTSALNFQTFPWKNGPARTARPSPDDRVAPPSTVSSDFGGGSAGT